MLTKKQSISIKLSIFFLWLLLMFTVADHWASFSTNLLYAAVFLLFSLINYWTAENPGMFKNRRNNLLFELLLLFLLLLVIIYVR